MTREQAEAFVRGWLEAWNRRDIDAVLDHFGDEASFASPLAVEALGKPEARGKEEIRRYWQARLETVKSLQFTLDHAVIDETAGEVVILIPRQWMVPWPVRRRCSE